MVREYVKSLVELTKDSNLGNFYKKVDENIHEVKMSRLCEVFTPNEIRLIKTSVNPQKKQCYKNATLLTLLFPDKVKYVEGYADVSGFPVEHAFNKINGQYVDITFELALGDDELKEYYAYGEYNIEEIERVVLETEVYGGVFNFYNRK